MFAVADIALIRACLNRTVQVERDNLVETYRKVFAESGASEREQDSALAQMEFVRTILTKLPSSREQTIKSIIESLDYIRTRLRPQKETGTSPEGEAKQSDASSQGSNGSIKRESAQSPRRTKQVRRSKQRGKG